MDRQNTISNLQKEENSAQLHKEACQERRADQAKKLKMAFIAVTLIVLPSAGWIARGEWNERGYDADNGTEVLFDDMGNWIQSLGNDAGESVKNTPAP